MNPEHGSVSYAAAVPQLKVLQRERQRMQQLGEQRNRQYHTLLEIHAKVIGELHDVTIERDNLESRVLKLEAEAVGVEDSGEPEETAG